MKRSRLIAWFGGSSLAVAFVASRQMRTPGAWVVDTIGRMVGDYDLRYLYLALVTLIAVNTAICFAILYGGYLLWMSVRRKSNV
jgi:hypothetical protein